MVIARYHGGLGPQHRRNMERLVTDSRFTGKWRQQHTVYRFMANELFLYRKETTRNLTQPTCPQTRCCDGRGEKLGAYGLYDAV